ncbi:MAG: LysM peptidoglycan-binding domain-containing protein [Anaerolineaceae bacterium]|nr:LysM peptidoglycan-binding domain-containing protein [Anaerolineaceae bacterium]
MAPELNSQTKICPTCGTKLAENSQRCLVCGRTFTIKSAPKARQTVQAQRLPELKLSLPLAIGLLFIILAVGGGLIFLVLRGTGQVAPPESTATASPSPTFEQSPTPTITSTPEPTFTPLPPKEYQIRSNDTCSLIAVIFEVSVRSIAELNNLPPDCGVLSVGQTILVPQPTPTASPMATSTLSVNKATESACQTIEYRVGDNDTLSGIAANYAVTVESLKTYNGLTSNNIYSGQVITIPLCQRLPTAGPTPTATLPPPYSPANLLLPADGAIFTGTNDSITLQWAAIGGMLQGESYAITIEDLTQGQGRKLVDYTSDTKYIIPATFRPVENAPHIIRWWVQPVRQSGTTESGDAIWVPAGSQSVPRVFAWSGIGAVITQAP